MLPIFFYPFWAGGLTMVIKIMNLLLILFLFHRVTKFKINWDNNTSDNSENIPPPKVDPNQMSSENSQSMEGPLKSASNGGLVTQSQTVVGMDTD